MGLPRGNRAKWERRRASPPAPLFGTCPYCGQRMLIRHGVRLSPRLADIFDMIERSGSRGITPEVLVGVFYPGRSTAKARAALKTNIVHINDRLEETDKRVRMQPRRDGAYRVITLKPRRSIKIGSAAAAA